MKTIENVHTELESSIGAHFTSEKKSADLFKIWVDEIVDGDEEYLPIVQNLNKHAKLESFAKFKAICVEDKKREAFVAKVGKAKGTDACP